MKKILFLTFVFVNFLYAEENTSFWGVALENLPNRESIYRSEYETGAIPEIIEFYVSFKHFKDKNYLNFEKSLFDIWSLSAVPCITLEPMYFKNGKEKIVNYKNILNGKYDAYLRNFASQIKRFKNPVIIRFAHEMNLSRYHWGQNKLNEKSPEIYIKMYRYVFNFFKKLNTNNALFAFCPNNDSVPNEKFNDFENYYPGGNYVDILGLDGYNFGLCATIKKMGWKSHWRSFENLFYEPLKKLRKLSKNKPIIIFETASSDLGGNKTKWIKKALYSLRELDIKAIIWFQVDKECNWKIYANKQREEIYNFFENNKSTFQKWAEEKINEKR